MSRYSQQDFEQNPGKYRLFKTARIAANVFTENGADVRNSQTENTNGR